MYGPDKILEDLARTDKYIEYFSKNKISLLDVEIPTFSGTLYAKNIDKATKFLMRLEGKAEISYPGGKTFELELHYNPDVYANELKAESELMKNRITEWVETAFNTQDMENVRGHDVAGYLDNFAKFYIENEGHGPPHAIDVTALYSTYFDVLSEDTGPFLENVDKKTGLTGRDREKAKRMIREVPKIPKHFGMFAAGLHDVGRLIIPMEMDTVVSNHNGMQASHAIEGARLLEHGLFEDLVKKGMNVEAVPVVYHAARNHSLMWPYIYQESIFDDPNEMQYYLTPFIKELNRLCRTIESSVAYVMEVFLGSGSIERFGSGMANAMELHSFRTENYRDYSAVTSELANIMHSDEIMGLGRNIVDAYALQMPVE